MGGQTGTAQQDHALVIVGTTHEQHSPAEQRIEQIAKSLTLDRAWSAATIRGPSRKSFTNRVVGKLSRRLQILYEAVAVTATTFVRTRFRNPSFVVSTSPPHSAAVAGHIISTAYRVPHIVDYRDPWTNSSYRPRSRIAVGARIEQALEKRILANSTAIVTVSQRRRLLVEEISTTKVRILPNGANYEKLLPPSDTINNGTLVRLGYVGSVYGMRIQRLQHLIDHISQHRQFPCTLEILGYSLIECEHVVSHPKVPHRIALEKVAGMDIAVLLNGYDDDVPTKLYEYVLLGLPVLEVGPPVAKELIPETTLANLSDLNDPEAIQCLQRQARLKALDLTKTRSYERQSPRYFFQDLAGVRKDD